MSNKVISTVDNYSWKKFYKDFSAAISVVVICLPQNMAYALIAGLNPIYGLYTFIISSLLNFFITGSSYLIVGPTNIVALALASTLNNFNIAGPEQYLQYILLLTFTVGLVQFLLGILKLGKLINYISRPVILGLTSGIALIIAVGQLDEILGYEIVNQYNVVLNFVEVIKNISRTNWYALGLGIITLLIVLFSNKLFINLPSYFIGVIIPAFMTHFLELGNKVATVGQISSALPKFSLINPSLSSLSGMLGAAVSIAVLCFIQLISIVKNFEKKTGQEINLSREITGQGIINMTGAFFSSFVITGSITNSFANLQAGARSRFAGFFASLIVLITLFLFSDFIGLIPIPSLAAIVILVAFYMIDKEEIKTMLTVNTFDMYIFSATFAATIILPRLDYAIFFGIIISSFFLLKNTRKVSYTHISHNKESVNEFQEKKPEKTNKYENKDVIIINLSGNINFHNKVDLQKKLNRDIQLNDKFLLSLRNVEHIDVTILEEIEDFLEKVKNKGGEVMISEVNPKLYNQLKKFGIIDKIGEENCFYRKDKLYDSTKTAFKNMQEIE